MKKARYNRDSLMIPFLYNSRIGKNNLCSQKSEQCEVEKYTGRRLENFVYLKVYIHRCLQLLKLIKVKFKIDAFYPKCTLLHLKCIPIKLSSSQPTSLSLCNPHRSLALVCSRMARGCFLSPRRQIMVPWRGHCLRGPVWYQLCHCHSLIVGIRAVT